jgi:hypothetical protein
MQIHINSFVKRQTSNSSYSHFEDVNSDDNWELLGNLIEDNFDQAKEGYRKEVLLVPIPSNSRFPAGRYCFYSGVVKLKDGELLGGRFESRKEGETPRKHITSGCSSKLSHGGKIPAKSVQIVLYSSTVLAEDDDNELPPEEGNWEVISINASSTEGEMPINPNTLMHNHFGSDGGTDTKLSDSEFITMLKTSFEYWKDKVMATEPN